MANLITSSFTIIIAIITMNIISSSADHEFAREIGISRRHKREKMSHLHFYFQEVVSGKKPTSVTVVQANATYPSTSFGEVHVIDDALTETPDLSSSKQIGRAQGMYISADTKTFGVCMVLNFVFTVGKYNGSTLAVLGRNEIPRDVRELAIVGGTGRFRFATGYAQLKTYQFNKTTTGDANLEFDAFVKHYY